MLSGHFGLDLVAWLFWTLPSTARLAHMEVTGRRCYSDINGGRFQRPLLGGAWGCRSSAWAADVARSGGDGTWPPQDQHSPDLGAAAGEEIKLPRENPCACTCQNRLYSSGRRLGPASPFRAGAEKQGRPLPAPSALHWSPPPRTGGPPPAYSSGTRRGGTISSSSSPGSSHATHVLLRWGSVRPAERGPQALQVPRKVG